jgi:hypothetical protein
MTRSAWTGVICVCVELRCDDCESCARPPSTGCWWPGEAGRRSLARLRLLGGLFDVILHTLFLYCIIHLIDVRSPFWPRRIGTTLPSKTATVTGVHCEHLKIGTLHGDSRE